MNHRIVCTTQEPSYLPTTHAHIVAVGTGVDPDHADQKWTLQQVLTAMDRGDTFYTQGVRTGKIARVVPVNCARCGHRIITTTADSTYDNNLDSLRRCNWS